MAANLTLVVDMAAAASVPVTDPIPRSNIAYAFHFYASQHIFNDKIYEISTKVPIIVRPLAAQTVENSVGSINYPSFQCYVDWMNRSISKFDFVNSKDQ